VSWEEQLVINERLSYFTDNPNTILIFEVVLIFPYIINTFYLYISFCSYWISLKAWKYFLKAVRMTLDGIAWHGHSLNLSVVTATRTLTKNVDYNFINTRIKSVGNECLPKQKRATLVEFK